MLGVGSSIIFYIEVNLAGLNFILRSIDEPFTILTKLKGVPSEVITTILRRLLQNLFCRHGRGSRRSINKEFDLGVEKSCKTRYRAFCKSGDEDCPCPWRINGTKQKGQATVEVNNFFIILLILLVM